MYTIDWTNHSMPNAGLLYESYRRLAYIRNADGRSIGDVLELTNGKYKASTATQVCVGREFSTAREAVVALIAYVDPSYVWLD